MRRYTNFWEELEGADVLKDVGDGEDVAADDRHMWYLLLPRLRARAEPVDVQEDLGGVLSEDGRNHKVAIIEERKHGIEPAPHSDRNKSSGLSR